MFCACCGVEYDRAKGSEDSHEFFCSLKCQRKIFGESKNTNIESEAIEAAKKHSGKKVFCPACKKEHLYEPNMGFFVLWDV